MTTELEKAKATMEKAEKEYRKACHATTDYEMSQRMTAVTKVWETFQQAYYAYQELLKKDKG